MSLASNVSALATRLGAEIKALRLLVYGNSRLTVMYANGGYPALPATKPDGIRTVTFYGPVQPTSLPTWIGYGASQAIGEYIYAELV